MWLVQDTWGFASVPVRTSIWQNTSRPALNPFLYLGLHLSWIIMRWLSKLVGTMLSIKMSLAETISCEDLSVASLVKKVAKHLGRDTCQVLVFLQQMKALLGAFSTSCLLPSASKTCQRGLYVASSSLLSGCAFLSLGLKKVVSLNLGEIPS